MLEVEVGAEVEGSPPYLRTQIDLAARTEI